MKKISLHIYFKPQNIVYKIPERKIPSKNNILSGWYFSYII